MYCASVIFLASHAHLAIHDELRHALHSSQQGEVENVRQHTGNMCTSNCSVMSHSCWSRMLHGGCFTTCGHYCRRWFPRSLWLKKFK